MIVTKDSICDSACDVLVIDDDEDIVYLLISCLATRGIHVKGMTSGKDLIDVLARDQPRLILLDVIMPTLSGSDLYNAIKNELALGGTKVYYLSAMPREDLARLAEQSGVDGYIAKPFTMDEIDAAIAAAGIVSLRRDDDRGSVATDQDPVDLDAVLGYEEARLLKAIRAFPGDVDSLHVMTGIPRECIEAKVAALVELGLVRRVIWGYEATEKGVSGKLRRDT
ncbi:MAG: response regulator [Candidatus Sigynarchaeota archaeon]